MEVVGSSLNDNIASLFGGAIAIFNFGINLPTNLGMYPTYIGPGYDAPYYCNPSTNGSVYREWDLSRAVLKIEGSDISRNLAGRSADVPARRPGLVDHIGSLFFGGGIFAQNVELLLLDSNVTENSADVAGGGVRLDGLTSLRAINTYFARNMAKLSGAAVSAVGPGAVVFTGGSVLDIGSSSKGSDGNVPGIAVLGGGKLNLGETQSTIRCSSGEKLLFDSQTYPKQFDNWQIDCTEIRQSFDNPSCRGDPTRPACVPNRSFLFPTCEQLQIPSNTSHPHDLRAYGCLGLPLAPPMLLSTGTASCRSCANNFYSLQQGQRKNGELVDIKCEECPFGLDCSEGGAALRVKKGTHTLHP
jgi:hypothetical protein